MIVAAIGASSGIFKEPEVAVTVTVVLLATLLTPLIMRGAFAIRRAQDAEGYEKPGDSSSLPSAIETGPAA